MLAEIHVTNLGVIKNARIDFGEGMHVLTGETGAGKTLMVEALSLICGARADSAVVGPDSEEAIVEARFVGVESPEWAEGGSGELVVSRAIASGGRNRAYMNGRLASLAQLREAVGPLVAIHGQHSAIRLLGQAEQLAAVDRAGGSELASLLEEFHEEFDAWRTAARVLEDLETDPHERARKIDLLAFQAQEINEIDPRIGEDAELELEIAVLSSAVELRASVQRASQALDAAAESLAGALEISESPLPALEAVGRRADSALIEIRDMQSELRSARNGLDDDPARLESAQRRLLEITRLKRKYGPEVSDVLGFRDASLNELEVLGEADGAIAAATEAEEAARARAGEAALALSEARSRVADQLAKSVVVHLEELAFAKPLFEIEIERRDPSAGASLSRTGIDSVDFKFSANERHRARGMAKVASGGELARVMLALELVCGEDDESVTMVFDEVDAGIGGETAVAVAEKLARLGDSRQVLCVTHLPQVASRGRGHFRVDKKGGVAEVKLLDSAERVAELSRMLAGEGESDHARAHAEELLEMADSSRTNRLRELAGR